MSCERWRSTRLHDKDADVTRAERRKLRFRRVSAASRAGLPALTILLAKAYLAHYPDDGFVWSVLGINLQQTFLYDEAVEAISRAIVYCPEAQRHLVMAQMGHVFDDRGDYPQAEVWYRQVIEAKATRASGYIYLGSALVSQGRLDEAETAFRDATRCTGGCIDEAYANLGWVLRAQGRFAEAADCLTHALNLDPKDRAVRKALRDVTLALKTQNRIL